MTVRRGGHSDVMRPGAWLVYSWRARAPALVVVSRRPRLRGPRAWLTGLHRGEAAALRQWQGQATAAPPRLLRCCCRLLRVVALELRNIRDGLYYLPPLVVAVAECLSSCLSQCNVM